MRYTSIIHTLILLIMLAGVGGCEDTTMRSSVPHYPVSIRINTQLGMFVHFVSSNIYSYIIVDADGIHFNGQTYPRDTQTAYGYAGVVVYIDGDGEYSSYDLCCPNCVSKRIAVNVDGMFATCPECGEQYDLGSGYAVPQKGISKETLCRYRTIYSNGMITVSN